MQILSSRSMKRLTVSAIFLASSLILSYIEIVTGISSVLPLPGMKLGLANIAIMIGIYMLNACDIVIISILKILLTSFLFGTPVSFLYSFSGGVVALIILLIIRNKTEIFSWVGIGVACAAAHNIGQFIVSFFMFGKAALYYLPFLILAGIICGLFSGIVCLSASPVLFIIAKKL